jgi:hypothetical protein
MSDQWSNWLALALASDSPVLPSALAVQIWLHLGWSVVLASIGAGIVGRWLPAPAGKLDGRQWGVALALALWTWMPGPYSPAYWLGLAFQAPSVVTVLLCDAQLRARFFSTRSGMSSIAAPHWATLTLAVLGVVTGWALMLDTFALLPHQLYAWGGSPVAMGMVLVTVMLPWVIVSTHNSSRSLRLWVAPAAVFVFAAARLPSGNVWDAILDPWLWLMLHGYLAHAIWRKARR